MMSLAACPLRCGPEPLTQAEQLHTGWEDVGGRGWDEEGGGGGLMEKNKVRGTKSEGVPVALI